MKKNKFYDQYHLRNRNKKFYSVIGDHNFTYYLTIKHIRSVLAIGKKPKLDIVDFGCGVGTIDFYLAEKGHSVTGIDISKDAIQIANSFKDFKKYKKVTFLEGDLEKNIKKNKKYDFAICSEIIEHVEDDDKLLKIINRSLRKDGFLYLSTPSLNAPLYKLGFLKEFDRRVGHLRRYKQQDLEELIIANQFEVLLKDRNESFLRNALFTIPPLGYLIKFIRGPLVPIFHCFDHYLVKLFGESNLIFICRKK